MVTTVVHLAPRRMQWIEQRHAAGLGMSATSAAWLVELGKVPRSRDSVVALTPEAEYLLVTGLRLRRATSAKNA